MEPRKKQARFRLSKRRTCHLCTTRATTPQQKHVTHERAGARILIESKHRRNQIKSPPPLDRPHTQATNYSSSFIIGDLGRHSNPSHLSHYGFIYNQTRPHPHFPKTPRPKKACQPTFDLLLAGPIPTELGTPPALQELKLRGN